jgi:elongation factor Ts
MVKALRDRTGLSMMECKKALSETGGDPEKAVDWLRTHGQHKVESLSGRETSQGRVAVSVDPHSGRGGMVELRCETAPVSKTDEFIALAALLARQAAAAQAPTAQSLPQQRLADDPSRTVADAMREVGLRLRENMQIAQAGRLAGVLGHYLHFTGQVGVLVAMSAARAEAVRTDVCMHVAAAGPLVVRREQVDAARVAREREVAAANAPKDKPANILDKIIAGKLNRWYSEIVLLEQPFVKDDKQTVGQMLQQVAPGLTVNAFLRYEVGQRPS